MRDNWYVDSGATAHMTNRRDILKNVKVIKQKEVIIANDRKLKAELMGDINIKLSVDGTEKECVIKNVFYVPNLCTNLLSVKKVTNEGYEVTFRGNTCFVKNEQGETLAKAQLIDGMYKLDTRPESVTALVASENSSSEKNDHSMEWHRKLGHVSYGNMRFLKNVKSPKVKCVICVKAKQTRRPFGSSKKRTTEVLELVHTDVNGPLPVESLSGCKYFMTVIDDYSKKVFLYPMKLKSEVFDRFNEFKIMAEKQTGKQMKAIKSDNGGEYVNFKFEDLCKEYGILHQKTIPYTPQQNGVAERYNRTIMERVRSLLMDSNLRKEFWAEAASTVTHLLNVIPKRGMEKSPNEKWNGESFDLKKLRIFGETAMAHIPKEKRKKLDAKSIECIFMGYAPNGYRLYDNEKKKIIISRDVVFLGDKDRQAVNEINWEDVESSFVVKEEMICDLPFENTPTNYEEAMIDKEADKWLQAMKEEYESLLENKTWILTDLPEGKRAIKSKWVYTIKKDAEGNIVKYKARLVAKGYAQKEGIDYTETFSPVVRYTTIRFLLAMSTKLNLQIHQMDAVTAFLNGKLKEEVYMEQPNPYEDGTKRSCRLLKSIYGLKQASKVWNDTLNAELLKRGLKRSIVDQCIYFSIEGKNILIVAIYVDDILIFFNDPKREQNLRNNLSSSFKMKFIGKVSSILGIRVIRDYAKNTISIDQSNYIGGILKRFNMSDCNPAPTPIDVNQKISMKMSPDGDKERREMMGIPYREAIGSLLYLAMISRPDINFSVNLLSRYCENPGKAHWGAVKRVLRYLKGTIDMKITYGSNTDGIVGYSDADWASDLDQRRSTTGYLFTMCGGGISWNSKKQSTVALSSTESEYMAAVAAIQEGIWLSNLYTEVFADGGLKIKICCDNKGAIQVILNNNFSPRTKHIDIRAKFIREKVESGNITIEYRRTSEMPADILTKVSTHSSIMKHVSSFGF